MDNISNTHQTNSKVTFDNEISKFFKIKKGHGAMGLQRVKIVSDNDSLRTGCFVGEHELHGVRGVDFRQTAGEFPQFNFDVSGLPDIDAFGDVQFSFTPETVQQAAVVLRNELLKRGDLYDSFLASMRSAIDDDFWNTRNTCGNELDIGEDDFSEAAELMLKRVIGLERTV